MKVWCVASCHSIPACPARSFVGSNPIGEVYSAALSHPFLTDLQRIAWHGGYVTSKNDLAHLHRPDRSELTQPVDRVWWNLGGVTRIGPPRRLFLVGGMVIGQRVVPR